MKSGRVCERNSGQFSGRARTRIADLLALLRATEASEKRRLTQGERDARARRLVLHSKRREQTSARLASCTRGLAPHRPTRRMSATSRFVRVLYSFNAEEAGELSVRAGDLYLLKGA